MLNVRNRKRKEKLRSNQKYKITGSKEKAPKKRYVIGKRVFLLVDLKLVENFDLEISLILRDSGCFLIIKMLEICSGNAIKKFINFNATQFLSIQRNSFIYLMTNNFLPSDAVPTNFINSNILANIKWVSRMNQRY